LISFLKQSFVIDNDCEAFYRHKIQLISPFQLRKAGFTVIHVRQKVGQYVITAPGAFHFGISRGENISQAWNFICPYWLFKVWKNVKPCECVHKSQGSNETFQYFHVDYDERKLKEFISKPRNDLFQKYSSNPFK